MLLVYTSAQVMLANADLSAGFIAQLLFICSFTFTMSNAVQRLVSNLLQFSSHLVAITRDNALLSRRDWSYVTISSLAYVFNLGCFFSLSVATNICSTMAFMYSVLFSTQPILSETLLGNLSYQAR